MEAHELQKLNTTALAFLGDAIYESAVREHILERGMIHADRLHRAAVEYVRADAQASIIKALLSQLTPEETALVKRARNRKSASKPKNADAIAYKWATAFEALIGYLHLKGEQERLTEIILQSISLIENGGANGEETD